MSQRRSAEASEANADLDVDDSGAVVTDETRRARLDALETSGKQKSQFYFSVSLGEAGEMITHVLADATLPLSVP